MGGKRRTTVDDLPRALQDNQPLFEKYPELVSADKEIAALHRQYLQTVTELVQIEEHAQIAYALLPHEHLKQRTLGWSHFGCVITMCEVSAGMSYKDLFLWIHFSFI